MFAINASYLFDWYSISYLVSSILTFLVLLYMGWRKGYPLFSWILILVTGSLFFIIGTKLLTFRSEEWSILFREGVFPHTDNKSAIGGMLFALLGIQLSRSWLKVREFILDTYALVVPLGLAVQKVGCLFAGCCFGTPTTLPWGIQYAQGTAAHYHQWISNVIPASESFSLPVHPLPLYEMITYLLIFGALILLAPHLKKKGSRFLLAFTLLALSRFTLEFFRDPAATVALGQSIGGLKAIQWVMLLVGTLTGSLLLRKKRPPAESMEYVPESHSLMGRKLCMILFLSLLMWAVHDGFSPTEMLVMNFKLLPALILFGAHSWMRFMVPGFRLAGIIILVLPLLIMGQSLPVTDKEEGWESFHSFGVGGTFGSFNQAARYNEYQGSCGPSYDMKYYEQSYGTATLNYQYTKQKGFISRTYGGSLIGGIVKEDEIDFPYSATHYIIGLHPYMDFNARWIGMGFGASIGYLNYIPTTPIDESIIYSGIKTFPILPSFKFRLGPYDIINLEYKFLDEFPSQLPFPTHQLSLGTGLGRTNGSGIRIGLTPPEEGFFISANALIDNSFMIQAKLIHTSPTYADGSNSSFFSFGFSYRLPVRSNIQK